MMTALGQRVIFGDEYYADQSHNAAPWRIRNGEHRVVGRYTNGSVSWPGVMKEADKEWLAGLVKQKIDALAES